MIVDADRVRVPGISRRNMANQRFMLRIAGLRILCSRRLRRAFAGVDRAIIGAFIAVVLIAVIALFALLHRSIAAARALDSASSE